MDHLDKLRRVDDPPDLQPGELRDVPTRRTPLYLLLLLMLVIGVGLWWWTGRRQPAAAPAVSLNTPLDAPAPVETVSGLGMGEPDPNAPGLSELDAYVRPLLSALSDRPELAALLATDDLVRRFVVSVETVARGASPAAQVRAVAPSGEFTVRSSGGATVIDPSSYARYDGLVRMVEDLEPEALARIYGRLKPRLDEAYAELGVPGTFDEVMTRALRHLLDTPELPASARVQRAKGITYAYSDEALEGLSSAQRQLLRLGPERAARVKEHLRRFGLALGIPQDRLQ
jgi:hypothetical protein